MATSNYKQVFQRAKKRLGGRLADAKGAIALEAVTKIIQRTPVDTGLARGNWNVGFGQPDLTDQRPAPKGIAPIARAKVALGSNRSGAGPVRVIYITNKLPYMRRLEFGWSKQAPNGMVRITLAELPERVGRILNVDPQYL